MGLRPGGVGEVTSLSGKSSNLVDGLHWKCPLCDVWCHHVNTQVSHLSPCQGYASVTSWLNESDKEAVHAAISADAEVVQFLCTTDDRFLANLVQICSNCTPYGVS